ncbi:MAG: phosphomannomutase [Fibrobacteria bacterium]|nr:phosphomannomutase [Fibrobacteria bacterium]
MKDAPVVSAKVNINELMKLSHVKFGTSGARGLVSDMTDRICYIYTCGFLQYLQGLGEITKGKTDIAVAGDLRQSTPGIMRAVFQAIIHRGYTPVNCGLLPSPAIALYGITNRVPAIMVTGSHIPDDRNGIKFNKSSGEILKSDEVALKTQTVEIDESLFDEMGSLLSERISDLSPITDSAKKLYYHRYLNYFPKDFLSGKHIGFYQHSAVGKELLPDILCQLGAHVSCFGESDTFVPVDTEAIRTEDVKLAKDQAAKLNCDVVFSTDGDSDRPLISDETGTWLRGDIIGILCSAYLEADSVTTPVSCNTALEKSGLFKNTRRTQIGSPFVVASMIAAKQENFNRITGYEANGGFLTNSTFQKKDKNLAPLPTRDALLPLLCIMGLSIQKKLPISEMVGNLPQRFTISSRLKDFPVSRSQDIIKSLHTGNMQQDILAVEKIFKPLFGPVTTLDTTDGVRIVFESEEIVHLRPSGNAPEFRCYNEADTEVRAQEMNNQCIKLMESWR